MTLFNIRDHVIDIATSIDSAPMGLTTGIRSLDTMTRGMQGGELIIVAGRPGMGKSSLMVNVVNHVKDTGPPLVFSMEMGRTLLIERLLADSARVSFARAKAGRLQDAEKSRLLEAAQYFAKKDIYIEGTSLATPVGVERTILEAMENNIQLKFIAIDHLHYMKMHKGEWSVNDEIGQITKYLKAFARQYNIPIMLLCQLSRACESREDHRPQLNDLRDSGSIEQDADQVWFLYRDSYYTRNSNSTDAEIIVAKQRNGPTGTVRVTWDGPTMSFREGPELGMGF